MNTFTKKLFAIALLTGIVSIAFADRGAGKKSKSRILLNISNVASFKNTIVFNLKTGLSYKGSLLSNHQTMGSSIMNNSIVTYQKGNTTYIVPYRHKIIMPEMRQGYTGVKLIIRYN